VVLTNDPWSAFIALAPQSELAAPAANPPRALEGVTFAVKNNIHAAGLATRAGSPAIDAPVSATEAEIVRRLKHEGARCVGTLNMHELALGISSANAYFGSVLNPRAAGRMAGGSSGGSAAAVAAGLISFALSTDTGGSSRIPAAFCGVVGMRPTMGRYPTGGIIALSPTRDTPGVIARTVAQVALVDEVVTGERGPGAPEPADVRLGVPRSTHFQSLSPEVTAASERTLDELARRGIVLIDIDLEGALDTRAALTVVAWEAMRAILGFRGLDPHDTELTATELAELADFASEVSSPDVRALLTDFIHEPLTSDQYRAALDHRLAQRTSMEGAIARAGVDALVYPTVPITAPRTGTTFITVDGVEHPLFPLVIRNTDPGAFAGLPSLTVPIPLSKDALPIGLGLEASTGRDRELLAVAARIEGLLTSAEDCI